MVRSIFLVNRSCTSLFIAYALFSLGSPHLDAAEKKPGPAGGDKAPPVQMLVPGFAVRALPLELKAINAVRYRADGKVVALGYDGKVYLLSDSDGDGLEDKAQVFYEPPRQILSLGMALTPPGYNLAQGVFIARKGSLVLELDTDGDDRADKEIVVAEGWETPKRFPGGASDAIGVAVDKEGSVYFGLGAANSQNGYLLHQGKPGYKITSERGTIQRISPDFSKREIIATGIRASVGLELNAIGDLFATDQEGATWMPNGNPFDELLHIDKGRHYGFPPRHPKHLPDVIDEPSVMDYGPQHQSTCGVQFNEPVNRGKIFGPAWWRGDALVAGESRGKIYRTKLVKTPTGYIGQDQIIACLSWLTIDQCVSPSGDLLISCHSGPVDWGNGPNATGKLFKITHVEPQSAQPVLAYATSPNELRIAFDQPLSGTDLSDISKRTKLTAGWFSREGDRFETFRPGYRAVQMQQALKADKLTVKTVTASEDRRTLTITTEEPRTRMNAVVDVEGWHRNAKSIPGELPQANVLSVAASLSGASVEWTARDGSAQWTGWLPHFDLGIARSLSTGSAEHARLWELMKQPGTLTLRGQLDLWNLLRPALQHGTRLDYTLPPEVVSLRFAGSRGTRARIVDATFKATIGNSDNGTDLKDLTFQKRTLLPVEVTVPTGDASELTLTWSTTDDGRPRPMALHRVLVPWASADEPPVVDAPMPQLTGGDRARGELLFKNVCAVCHTMGEAGGRAGPDLSNLIYRDYGSVFNDIANPNNTINPDHVAFNITLRDGSVVVGVVIEDQQDSLLLAGPGGPPITVKKADIGHMKASATSLMPPGFDQALGVQGMKDLMNYLLLPGVPSTEP